MNNDDWIRLLDRVPSESRASFDAMRGHFGDVYNGTLRAFLTMLTGVEGKLDTAIADWQADTNDRKQIGVFLERIIKDIEALSSEVTMIRAEVKALQKGQQTSDKARAEMAKRITKIERDLHMLQQEVAALKLGA